MAASSTRNLLVSLTKQIAYELKGDILKTKGGHVVEGSKAIAQYLGTLIPGLSIERSLDASVIQWYSKSEELGQDLRKDKQGTLKNLNEFLSDKNFVVSNKVTLADLFLYSALHPTVAHLDTAQRYEFANVTRYLDLVQNIVYFQLVKDVATSSPALKFLDIDLNAPADPKPVKLDAADNKKNKKQATGTGVASAADDGKKKKGGDKNKEPAASGAAVNGNKDSNKEGKNKEKAPKAAEAPKVMSPSRIDLRVGKVLSVKRHPDADSLYVEEIEMGEEKTRQVVSGLVKHIKEEDFEGRLVVLVCNLKPAKMRGVESQAMVLCANSAEGLVELVQPPAGSQPGDRIYFEGHQGTPDAQLKSKEKVWETVQPHFKTSASKQGTYIDNGKECLMKTDKGVCTVASIAGGGMK